MNWEDGRRWGATCVSYQNVKTLQQKNTRTGESLSGAYLWARFLILVDEVSRQRIEAVISDLLSTGQFESAFEELADDLQS